MNTNIAKSSATVGAVRALHHLLLQICKLPHLYADNLELIAALRSQGTTASLDIDFIDNEQNENLKTTPMSLNTLKTYSNAYLIGGFTSLNSLRTQASEAIKAFSNIKYNANKRTKNGLNLKVQELEEIIQKISQDNIRLLQALSEAIEYFAKIKNAPDEKSRAKCARDASKLLNIITNLNSIDFNNIPLQYSTVTHIDSYRD